MNEFWAIYATDWLGYCCQACNDENGGEEILIATFFAKQNAERYIEKSRLKRPTWNRKFKYKSLLGLSRAPDVKLYKPIMPPHEPKINWK